MRFRVNGLAWAWVLLSFGCTNWLAAEVIAAEVEAAVEMTVEVETEATKVDRRSLNVQIVPAFPNLEWADELTGAETGRAKKIRPLIITDAGDQSN